MHENMAPEILAEELREKQVIRDYFGNQRGGVVVEVGANDPESCESQSLHLERLLGWRGLLVEPHPDLAAKARASRPGSTICECACTSPGKEGVLVLSVPVVGEKEITGHAAIGENLDEHCYREFRRIEVDAVPLAKLLDKHGVTSIDLLSIDVEGAELDVLSGAEIDRFRPRLILLEDKHLYLTKHRFLRRYGYRLVRRLNRNCWYVREGDVIPQVPLLDRVRLWKRMYISIWYKKLVYAMRHNTMEPFKTW